MVKRPQNVLAVSLIKTQGNPDARMGHTTHLRDKDFELSVYLRRQKLLMAADVSCSSRVSK
jgi:hypothetical protein